MKLSTTYKGYPISYDEYCDRWEAYDNDDNIIVSTDGLSLKEVKKRIDAIERKTKGPEAKSIPAFILDNYGWYHDGDREYSRIKTVKVTSEADHGEVWVSTGKKHFRKDSTEVYVDTPENRKIVAQIDDYRSEIDGLEADIERCEKSLQKYSQWRNKK